MMMFRTLILAILLVGCASITGEKEAEMPPTIHAGMPTAEIVDAAIKFGGQTIVDAAKVFKKLNHKAQASLEVQLRIIDNYKTWDGNQLVNAAKLYQQTAPNDPSEIFKLLAGSDRKLAREISFQIASEFPSKKMAQALDKILTDAIEEDEIFELLLPQLATAISRNGMRESYSVLRLGLFQTNLDAFAVSMIGLNPQKASIDFLDYLSQVPVEELRQLTLVTLDVYTCIAALRHLAQTPPPISHPKFEHLFMFATSRNSALAQFARDVISVYLPKHSKVLARRFAQLPNWIQVAYIESSREKITPSMSLFFQDLKRVSAQKEVIEEIDAIRM